MDKRIEAARVIIENEYSKALTVKEVMARVGVSRSHLAFLFKKETGATFKACLREARLKRLLELLIEEHAIVKQAAYSVGYQFTSNFARDFKGRFGKTPAAYRRKAAETATHNCSGGVPAAGFLP